MKQRPWRNLVVVLGLLAGMAGVAPASRPPAALAQAREPGTLYVQPGGTSTACSSWSDACELQAALDAAQSGDELWVAAGTYLPDYDPGTGTHTGDRSDSFQLVSGVALYGGFPGAGEPDFGDRDWSTYVTVLSGDIGTAEVDTDNSYHVVYSTGVTETVILDGFTITGGNANGDAEPDWDGGGMYNDDSSPTVSHCTFSNNHADQDGGGMHNGNESNPTLINVTFINNTAFLDGGGMHNHPYSNPTLTNVAFSGNTAGVDGGGMSNGDSSPTLTNVTFNANRAGRYGGGMYNWNSTPDLTNCTFENNSATNSGGGMENRDNSDPAVTNCILWDNTATTGNQMHNDASTPEISYSDIQDSRDDSDAWDTNLGTDLGGNIDADPLFVDAAAGDLRLQLTSPAIDAGDNSAPPTEITTDLGGHPRFVDVPSIPDTGYKEVEDDRPLVDMGAYEAPPPLIYVDADAGPARAQDGISWAGAFTDLQDALTWAVPGVEIWVAAGTYMPTSGSDRTVSFQLPKGVAVYGGFAGTEDSRDQRDWATQVTILSGNIGTSEDATDNSYHVVYSTGVTETAVLDGFTLTGGNADGSSWRHYYGGGMYNDDSSPTLSNVTFAGNSADYGGGMYNYGSSPTLTHVTFQGNTSDDDGGGMRNNNGSNPTLTNVTFENNSAGHGGGMANYQSSPTLTHVTFQGNTSDHGGGGMYNSYSSNSILINCIFWGNSSLGGGGMYNNLSSPTLTNCTFIGNSATDYGGGILNSDGTGGQTTPVLSNSLLWDNTPDQILNNYYYPENSTTISYSDVQGGCDTDPDNDCGLGNINEDPRFVDVANGDLRLQITSPAIDAGDNSAVPLDITTDLAGQPRFVDIPSIPDTGYKEAEDERPFVDMGAYEAQYFTLSVTKAGSGSGTVSSDPPGIDCGADCTEALFQATVVTLTATADTGSTFDGWSGACTGDGDCVIAMDGNRVVTATFTLQHQLSVALAGKGSGAVSSDPPGIDCGSDCTEIFGHGTPVTLTATADTGSIFSGWSGACTGSGGCALTMDSAQVVTGTFTLEGTGYEIYLPLIVRGMP